MRDEELKKQSHLLESRAEGASLVAPCTAQLAELNYLYQTTPIGLCLLDTDLRYVHINKVLADFNGCSVSEHIGRTLQEIIPDVFPFVASFFRQVLDTGEPFRNVEFRSATQSEPNRERDWLIDLYDYRSGDGVLRGVSVVLQDITERRRAEEAARQAQQSLLLHQQKEKENVESELKKERELNDLKSRFIAMASHEFRTPLTTILSSGDLLGHHIEQLFDGQRPRRLNRHLHKIDVAVKHMVALLNDVLYLGKAEARPLEFDPRLLDVEDFCCDLVEEFQWSAGPAYKLVFSCRGLCRDKRMDQKQLRHILTNLLSNAIKYSLDGGTVYFDLTCTDEDVVFHVRDEGIGIPETDQQRLFQSFHRGQNVGAISGTGLGLTITKHAVEAHGGSIAFESKIDVGTSFTVIIPTAPLPETEK